MFGLQTTTILAFKYNMLHKEAGSDGLSSGCSTLYASITKKGLF